MCSRKFEPENESLADILNKTKIGKNIEIAHNLKKIYAFTQIDMKVMLEVLI